MKMNRKNFQDVNMLGHINYLLEHFGYFGIIVALIGGIIGVPIPDEVLLTYVGFNVFQGKLTYFPALFSAFLGAFGGITLSYILGIKLGLPFLHRFGPKFHITEEKINKTKNLFSKYGSYLLFFGYFIPGVRHITAYLAGINGYSYKRFSLFAYLGALTWSFTFITLGTVLGEKWSFVLLNIEKYKLIIIPAVILFAGVVAVMYWRKRRSPAKQKEIFE
jgi:membrane protein DedA with SNARE-associated domain